MDLVDSSESWSTLLTFVIGRSRHRRRRLTGIWANSTLVIGAAGERKGEGRIGSSREGCRHIDVFPFSGIRSFRSRPCLKKKIDIFCSGDDVVLEPLTWKIVYACTWRRNVPQVNAKLSCSCSQGHFYFTTELTSHRAIESR